MAGVRLSAPLFALSHGHGPAATGVLVALFSFTQIFLSLPAGRFADRHGLRRPMAVYCAAATLGIGLAAVFPTYAVLCLSAVLSGGAVGSATIALQRYVGRVVPSTHELRKAFALVSLAPAGANVIGPLLAGVLIDNGGWRIAFAVLAVLPPLAWLLLRDVKDVVADAPEHAAPQGSALGLIALPGMKNMLIVNTLMASAWEFHSFMVPVLGHDRGIAATAIGLVMGAFAAGVVAIRIAVPMLAARVRDFVLVTGALVVTGLAFVAYPAMPTVAAMAACSLVVGMGLGGVQPLVLTLLHAMAPEGRQGQVFALRLVFGNIASLTTPIIVGAASGLITVSGVFWIAGAVVALGGRAGFGMRGAHKAG